MRGRMGGKKSQTPNPKLQRAHPFKPETFQPAKFQRKNEAQSPLSPFKPNHLPEAQCTKPKEQPHQISFLTHTVDCRVEKYRGNRDIFSTHPPCQSRDKSRVVGPLYLPASSTTALCGKSVSSTLPMTVHRRVKVGNACSTTIDFYRPLIRCKRVWVV